MTRDADMSRLLKAAGDLALDRIDEMRAENDRLRAENDEMRALNRQLENDVERLQKSLARVESIRERWDRRAAAGNEQAARSEQVLRHALCGVNRPVADGEVALDCLIAGCRYGDSTASECECPGRAPAYADARTTSGPDETSRGGSGAQTAAERASRLDALVDQARADARDAADRRQERP